MHLVRIAIPLLVVGLLTPSLPAQEAESSTAPSERPARSRPERAPATQPDDEKPSATEHEITLDGQPLKYTATAGEIPLKDDAGKLKGKIFFISYERKREESEDVATRPLTFVFNGGPGAASIWLHLGTAGPKRVHLSDDGTPPAPPYRLESNESTWLDLTDLVFIDPVGTGFSRAADAEQAKQFYSVQGDL